jgi:SAM-dependent methyltransferase
MDSNESEGKGTWEHHSMAQSLTGYGDDLAYIHDVGFGFFAKGAVPGLLTILRGCGVKNGLVVDLGCGGGIWARQLVDHGYDVLGVDLSPSMIAIARARVPEARFETRSLLRFRPPPCAAVTAMGECVNYLFDPKNCKQELIRLFSRVYGALRPGGVFVFDVAEPGRGGGSYREGKDWTTLVQAEEDAKAHVLTRRITFFRQVGKFYRRGQETHRLQLYRGADLTKELRSLGFRVRLLRGYGKMRFPTGLVGLLARKPREAG